ncbi:MAG TPA: phage antirepressor KilAC domain-containing protein [Desulfosporosinus sp.]|nr:phage antirepressor KilAC domain-containing protein [Desulfosporosinus sp.]
MQNLVENIIPQQRESLNYMNTLIPIDYQRQRILTTAQLAEAYEADAQLIVNNFNRNKERYTEGKHFILLEGAALKDFKAKNQIDLPPNMNKLYLWPEKGAWLHAKSLNTDKAWEAYEMLVDDYYAKSQLTQISIPRSLSEALRLAADLAEKNEVLQLNGMQKDQIINELKPKATYYDLILQNKSLLAITKIAKDYGLSGMALNQILHEEKIQFKQGDCWILYQGHADKGYTQSKTQVIDEERSKLHTYWTQKGRLFIYDLLKNKRGILPIIERQSPIA